MEWAVDRTFFNNGVARLDQRQGLFGVAIEGVAKY